MTISRRAVVYLDQSMIDELETLSAICGLRQKSRLIAHLLNAALDSYRPAILAAQRARLEVVSRGHWVDPARETGKA